MAKVKRIARDFDGDVVAIVEVKAKTVKKATREACQRMNDLVQETWFIGAIDPSAFETVVK